MMGVRRLGALVDAFQTADGPPPQELLPFFRWSLSGALPVLLMAGLVSAAAGSLEALTALILGRLIDAANTAGPAAFFAEEWLLVLVCALFFLIARPLVFGFSGTLNAVVVAPNVQPLVLSRLNRWTLGQAVTFFDDDFAGRIAQKQMQTARAITDVASEVINAGFFALASVIGSILLLTTIDWRVALLLAVWLVGYIYMIRWFMPRIRMRSKARAGARAMVTGQIVDAITNIKTVKLFAHADHEDRAALGAMSEFRETALDFGELAATFRFTLMATAGVLPVLLIGGTLMLWSSGQATAGDIAAAGAISIRLAQMSGWVSFVFMAVYSNVGEVEDGMRTLTPPYTLLDDPAAVALPDGAGEIEFDGVGFAYGRKSGGVDNICLRISQGERLGIVGASGAGKSTLVALLLRLYDPEVGKITISGHSLREVSQETLRRRIGMVTQETAMFNRSARDNIAYGSPHAEDSQIIDAALGAEAHEFILGLQDHKGRSGYDAHLGERGVKLSGGQRQRIALARAILKDAPILVLDEATSALDSEVEAAIQNALERVMEGKTVLAIAHRLSTLAQMDRIIVLEEGRIAEEGTHEDLLARGGVYARYWNRQSGGFISPRDAAE